MKALPATAALLLIDLQQAILDPRWGRLSNPDIEGSAAALLDAWRRSGRAVIHVHHHSREALSPYRSGQRGNKPLPRMQPIDGEPVIAKDVHSAFVGTGLAQHLDDAGIDTLVLAGVLTHNSLDATVRHAADLGFRVIVVPAATSAAEKRDLDGVLWTAEQVQALSLAILQGEYAELRSQADLGLA